MESSTPKKPTHIIIGNGTPSPVIRVYVPSKGGAMKYSIAAGIAQRYYKRNIKFPMYYYRRIESEGGCYVFEYSNKHITK